ncbi:MAG: sugar phosphate isomerase/epimerase family protein, partial [Oscillospiraceae bacterium]
MRLGGELFTTCNSPQQWANLVKQKGYAAAFCPIQGDVADDTIQAYRRAAQEQDIVIGEVGVWNNVLHPLKKVRDKAMRYAKQQLTLAEKIGANCCVNISGTLNPNVWYGPHPRNFDRDTLEDAVKAIQEIIDNVQPQNTFYTLEPSPWLYPTGIESYLTMIKMVNRKAFAVHWDPVNMISTPRRYYQNGEYLKQCIQAFGPLIKACHLKDIYMDETFTLYMQER